MVKVRDRLTHLSGIWCAVMHDGATWPIHGHYQCRKCKRVYSVPWEQV
jgi:hypothetical protein